MLSVKSIRKLILESNARDLHEREESDNCEHREHKRNIFDLVDTITIISAENSKIFQIDWMEFNSKFDEKYMDNSSLNIRMLRTIMETNLPEYLMNIPVFQGLPNSKLELISRFCHYHVEKEGATICKEGDHGEEVFIILCGEVKVEAMASERMVELFEKGILSPLAKKESSSSLGDSTSQGDTHSRKASVNYKNDYDPPKHDDSNRQKSFIRRRQTMLKAGHDCRREKIKRSCHTEGTCSKEDAAAESMRRICRLDVPSPNHTVELARFRAGDYFGEISTFIELPRVATVTATSNVLMVSISKSSFRKLYHCISPDLEKDVETIVKQHMLQTLLQSKSPFLEVIDSEDAKRMADLSTIRAVSEGEVIFNEGDEADDFYFVYSGQLAVSKSTTNNEDDTGGQNEEGRRRRIGTLYSGDYFGEMALLNQSKRLATIVTTSTTVLMSITRENFYKCFQETPQLVAEFIVRMKGVKVDLDSLLNYSKSKEEFGTFLNSIGCHLLSCYNDMETLSMQSIMDKYFTDGASHLIDDEEIKELFQQKEKENDSNFVKEVQTKLKGYLENDFLPKFKQSNSFELLTKRMRAYDEIDVQLLA